MLQLNKFSRILDTGHSEIKVWRWVRRTLLRLARGLKSCSSLAVWVTQSSGSDPGSLRDDSSSTSGLDMILVNLGIPRRRQNANRRISIVRRHGIQSIRPGYIWHTVMSM